ncbi:MAG: 16S rRNA (adenine(1518)-N(6)/adenine(1519)-N(6))-dimethyltransferase RsmA [Methylococcales bacterium]|nr:16S rRNA (adenine(1518)-N(6)/adenine(1519)-N(6))-dimethyltransferase RsmA [Methylococcales bacterium]
MAHQARKRFGQNFLQNHGVIYQIITAIQAQKNQAWVEIGPGLGALTQPLIDMGVKLDVVELDRDLVRYLIDKFKTQDNITIHSADALKFDFKSLTNADHKLRIIGNLPYNISTPLLFHLLKNASVIDDMHFMLQKEVVDRMCADSGNKKYGRLTVMMQYHCHCEALFEVPPESFTPAPKVMSAIVRLIPHAQPPVDIPNVEALNKVVTQAFNQRRKTIRNSLKKVITEDNIRALMLSPKARAEEISLSEFAQLATFIHHNPL